MESVEPLSEDSGKNSSRVTGQNLPAKAQNILLLLLFPILAGLASWALAEQTGNLAQVPLEISSKNYQFAELNAATIKVNVINGALVYGGLGLLVSVAVVLAVLAGGAGSGRASACVIMALLMGVLAGTLPCLVVMPLQYQSRNDDPSVLDLTMPLVYHAGLWLPIGLAAGLAFGFARSGSLKAGMNDAVAGLIGALFGTLFYEFLGAILLPMDKTVEPVAVTPQARMLAHLSVAAGIALSLAYSLKSKKKPASE
ncbi:MAG: hypothetical protein ACKO85_06025 [Isosphaeraceae bacterium]